MTEKRLDKRFKVVHSELQLIAGHFSGEHFLLLSNVIKHAADLIAETKRQYDEAKVQDIVRILERAGL